MIPDFLTISSEEIASSQGFVLNQSFQTWKICLQWRNIFSYFFVFKRA